MGTFKFTLSPDLSEKKTKQNKTKQIEPSTSPGVG